jgi:hypothetical protein
LSEQESGRRNAARNREDAKALSDSIEQTKELAEKSEKLINAHRKELRGTRH